MCEYCGNVKMLYAFLIVTFTEGNWCLYHTLHTWRTVEVTMAMIRSQDLTLSASQVVN